MPRQTVSKVIQGKRKCDHPTASILCQFSILSILQLGELQHVYHVPWSSMVIHGHAWSSMVPQMCNGSSLTKIKEASGTAAEKINGWNDDLLGWTMLDQHEDCKTLWGGTRRASVWRFQLATHISLPVQSRPCGTHTDTNAYIYQ